MADDVDSRKVMSLVERVERLKEDLKAIQTDIKDVLSEGKADGIDPKMINYLVKLRAMDPEKLQMLEAEQAIYRRAAGIEF